MALKLTQSEIINLRGDKLAAMTEAELLRTVETSQQLVSTRLSRLSRAGLSDSPAVRNIRANVNLGQSPATMSRPELISAIKGAQRFARSPYSTVRGYREELNRAAKALQDAFGGRKVAARGITPEKLTTRYGAAGELVYKIGENVPKSQRTTAAGLVDGKYVTLEQATRMWDAWNEVKGDLMGRFFSGQYNVEIRELFFESYADNPDANPDLLGQIAMDKFLGDADDSLLDDEFYDSLYPMG